MRSESNPRGNKQTHDKTRKRKKLCSRLAWLWYGVLEQFLGGVGWHRHFLIACFDELSAGGDFLSLSERLVTPTLSCLAGLPPH